MNKISFFAQIIALVSAFATLNYSFSSISIKKEGTSSSTTTQEDGKQYLGYGYDVTSGIPLYKTSSAIKLGNPILNISSTELLAAESTSKATSTKYINKEETSARKIAEEYGLAISGGVAIGAKIATVSVDLNTTFSRASSSTLTKVATEKFSTDSIVSKSRTAVIQNQSEVVSKNLSTSFLKDVGSISTIDDATSVLNKYGTHLITGYTLGGILELTNYFASDSADYTRQVTDSFSSQVQAGKVMQTSSVSGSFSDLYSSKDNNSHAVNKYQCATYGGKSFGALSIEDVFTFNAQIVDSKFNYEKWTESINDEFGLVIVDLQDSSSAMPLWSVLPLTNTYNTARDCLMKAYIKKCNGAYKSFCEEYQDITGSQILDGSSTVKSDAYSYKEYGYQYFSKMDDGSGYLPSYVSTDSSSTAEIQVKKGSIVAMDYDASAYNNQQVVWSTGSDKAKTITILDSSTGVFKVSDAPQYTNFSLQLTINGVNVTRRDFKIESGLDFEGGDGTEVNPYLITNASQLNTLAKNSNYWDKCFKLTNDIDMKGMPTDCGIIGKDENAPFKGQFNGDFHSISNVSFNKSNNYGNASNYLGLFGYNSGTISNLKLKADSTGTIYGKAIEIGSDSDNADNINNKYFKYLGGIAAYNSSTGKISNCYVSGLELRANFGATTSSSMESYLGGICGYNEGIIEKCSLKNSRIRLIGTNATRLYAGGIVGYNYSKLDNSINTCVCSYSKIIAEAGNSSSSGNATINETYAGGIAGYCEGQVSDCLVKSIDSSHPIIACGLGYSGDMESTNEKAYAGGLIGYFSVKNISTGKIKRSVVCSTTGVYCRMDFKLPELDANNVPRYSWSKEDYLGLFVGFSASTTSIFDNCYCEAPGPKYWIVNAKHYGNSSEGDISQAGTQFTNLNCNPSYKFADISAGINAAKVWFGDALDKPSLKLKDVVLSNDGLTIDSSNAKKTFYTGEEFKMGNISLNGTYTDGSSEKESFVINNYIVDYSSYDKTKPGTYPIYIKAYGQTVHYDVTVINPSATCLILSYPTDITYYEGDVFNDDKLVVTLHFDNGSNQILTKSQYTILNKNIAVGANKVVIKYNDNIFASIEINGIERNVKSVAIKTLPTKTTYTVGSKILDLTGLTVDVTYEAMEPDFAELVVTKNYDSVEVVFSPIVWGKNEITICYGNYSSAAFEVQGTDQALIVNYASLVNSISSISDIAQKNKAISEAIKLRDQLAESTDESVIAANQKLQQIIEDYNNFVKSINNDFNNI